MLDAIGNLMQKIVEVLKICDLRRNNKNEQIFKKSISLQIIVRIH